MLSFNSSKPTKGLDALLVGEDIAKLDYNIVSSETAYSKLTASGYCLLVVHPNITQIVDSNYTTVSN
jgi:hypothetical protein